MQYITIIVFCFSCSVSMNVFSCGDPEEDVSFIAEAEIVKVIENNVKLRNAPIGKYCFALVRINVGDEVFDRNLNIKKVKGVSCKKGVKFSAFFTFDNMCVELIAFPQEK